MMFIKKIHTNKISCQVAFINFWGKSGPQGTYGTYRPGKEKCQIITF